MERFITELDSVAQKSRNLFYDEDGDDEDAVDLEPGTAFEIDPELRSLVSRAENLVHQADPKLIALVDALAPLIKNGANLQRPSMSETGCAKHFQS